VLHDHEPARREHGFISRRIMDAAACGALVISDPAADLEAVFGGLVWTYESVAELRGLVLEVLADPGAHRDRQEALAARVREAHTADRRAEALERIARALVARRTAALAPAGPSTPPFAGPG
jgi:spore maturation protein CgeB